ncbi:MAG: ABC transporter permease [Thermoleophilia bacterium]|nr:ABC transporter permease [Thermoleophilia bacterium]
MQLVHDTWFMYRRQLRRQMRVPVWIVISLIQPILYLVLFGPLLKGVVDNIPGFTGNEWAFFVPGLIVQLGLFGTAFAGFSIIDEVRSGVIERTRVTPLSRMSMLLGRVLKDMTVLLVQATVLIGMGVALGLRAPWQGVVAGVLIMCLLGGAFASLSYAAGLTFKDEGALAAVVNFVTVPILLLSGILLPMNSGPNWLQNVAKGNPVLYIVDSIRSLFLGHNGDPHVVPGLLCAAVIAAVGLAVGTRTFHNEQA